MSIQPRDVTPEVSEALAHLRIYAAKYPTMGLSAAVNVLDNVGVFAEIDERNEYASAEEILADIENAKIPNTADPAEWGDTTSADMARHQGVIGGDVVDFSGSTFHGPFYGKVVHKD